VDFIHAGFPIRRPTDRRLLTAPRGLSQFCHVLHRLLVPRHPPNALTSLTTINRFSSSSTSSMRTGKVPSPSQSQSLFAVPWDVVLFELQNIPDEVARSFEIELTDRASCFVQLFNFQLGLGRGVGQARFELATPRLSSACSNQLSYWPSTDRSLKTE
jgi:hypothetical protein